MENYNGMYQQSISVSVSADNHNACIFIFNRFKKLCEAWCHSVTFSESKSARKGDVLGRELMINQTDYANGIITFRESIKCIQNGYRFSPYTVTVLERGTIPKDSRANL